jgi:hypothetical protein
VEGRIVCKIQLTKKQKKFIQNPNSQQQPVLFLFLSTDFYIAAVIFYVLIEVGSIFPLHFP